MSPCLVITSEIKSQPKIPFRTILELQILTGSQPLYHWHEVPETGFAFSQVSGNWRVNFFFLGNVHKLHETRKAMRETKKAK